MVALTNTVAALTLATLISLGQLLGDGMAAFETKNYKVAATLFTKVIEADSPYNPNKPTALYMRAQCFIRLDLKKDAETDITALLMSDPDEKLAELAGADYKKLTGKEWQGNRSTPEATWNTFRTALGKRDIAGVQRCVSGRFAATIGMALAQPEFFAEVARELGPLVSVSYNKDKSRALVSYREGNSPDSTDQLIMTKEKGAWTLSDESHGSRSGQEFGPVQEPAPVQPPKPVPVSDDEAKAIRALVVKLGAASFSDRKSAYAELKAFGAKARPELQKATGDPDPEISTSAKNLLDAIQ